MTTIRTLYCPCCRGRAVIERRGQVFCSDQCFDNWQRRRTKHRNQAQRSQRLTRSGDTYD